jgi:hypothetical protein
MKILSSALTLILGGLLFSFNLSAQFKNPDAEAAKLFMERTTMYVEDGFDKAEQKEWLEKYWMFDHKIEYVSVDEMKTIAKKKENNAVIMSMGVRNEAQISNDVTTEKEVYMIAVYLSESAKNCNRLQVDSKKKKELCKFSTTGAPTSEAGMKLMCQHFYNKIKNASGKSSGAARSKIPSSRTITLKEKTLYVPDYMTKFKATQLKGSYGFKIEVVDAETLNEAIMNNDPNVAYVTMIFSDKQFHMGLMVINAQDGMVLVDAGMGGVSLGIGGAGDGVKTLYPLGGFEFKPNHAKAIRFYYDKAAKRAAKGKD